MRGENMYVRWECVLEVGTRWLWVVEGACKVRICMWCENVYATWECVCEVTLNGGGVHTRWEYVREMRMCMWGENMRSRWLWMVEGATLHRGPKVTSCPREVTLGSGGDNSRETLRVTSHGCKVTFLYSIDDTSMMTKLRMMKIPRVWAYIVQSHLMWGAWDDFEVKVILCPHTRWLFCAVKMLQFGLI